MQIVKIAIIAKITRKNVELLKTNIKKFNINLFNKNCL